MFYHINFSLILIRGERVFGGTPFYVKLAEGKCWWSEYAQPSAVPRSAVECHCTNATDLQPAAYWELMVILWHEITRFLSISRETAETHT